MNKVFLFLENLILAIIVAILVLSLATAFTKAISKGLNESEINECKEWKKSAEKYPDYYLLGWQKEQCDHQGIEIDVEVR